MARKSKDEDDDKKKAKKEKEVKKQPEKKKRKSKEEVEPKRGRKSKEEVEPKRGRKSKEEDEKPKRGRKSKEEIAPKAKKRKSKEDEEIEVSRKSKKEIKTDAKVGFNPYENINATLDDIEKHIGVADNNLSMNEERLSTGVLMQDICLGGGITAGWYTNFGQEQTCKTTDAVTILTSALNAEIPVLSYFDYEGSASADYIANIMKNMGAKEKVENIFGVKDNKTGEWVIPPRIRYRSEGVAEKFFDFIASLERRLPDKKLLGDQWYYIYHGKGSDGKTNKYIPAQVLKTYDEKYYRKTGNYRVPAENGKLQALILVDSYPAMLPETQDVEDPNNAIATQARMFADQLKRVKGRMRSKRIAVVGINQLRKVPMAMYGPSESEPCGEALKLYCFGEDTHIFTDKGLIKGKNIDKVAKVLGIEGPEKPLLFKPMGTKPVIKVSTEFNFSMVGAYEHAVMALRKGTFKPEFVKLKDLTNEYYVTVKYGMEMWPEEPPVLSFDLEAFREQETNNSPKTFNFKKEVTPELAKVLGYLSGEGHVGDGHIAFSNADEDVFSDFIKCLRKVFNLSAAYVNSKIEKVEGRSPQLCYSDYSTELSAYLGYLGCNKTSEYKEVPWVILQSPREIVCDFIAALVDVEGRVWRKGNTLTMVSSSRTLIKQVQLLLLNMGILAQGFTGKYNWLNKYVGFHLSGQDVKAFAENITLASKKKQCRLDSPNVGNATQDILERVPKIASSQSRAKCHDWLYEQLDLDTDSRRKGRRYLRMSELPKLSKSLLVKANELKTAQEREKNISILNGIEDFARLTIDNNLLWVEVESIEVQEQIPTYDFNMPKTHTVVTDGLISHNSDCRLKFTSRSLSGAPDVKGKGQIEEEKSVQYKGNDQYRYIHVRAHKNKLSRPFIEFWMRLWITDPKGQAQGFDPVFDCYEYLKATGQVKAVKTDKRNKIFLQLVQGKSKDYVAEAAVNWLDFKRLILGDKKQMREIYDRIGMKPVMLRDFCFKQMSKGVGIELYNKMISEGSVEEPEERDGDEQDDDDNND